MTLSTPQRRKQRLVSRSHTFTREGETLLRQLSQDASDALGWTVGGSAVLRAILQYIAQQPSTWASGTLHPLIEQEITNGTFWGSKKK